jgi:hypothetical protein
MDGVPLPLSMRATTLWVVPMRAAMMCLSVNLAPVANLNHKDAQSAICLSSLRSWPLAVSVYSIVQAKVSSHIGCGMDLFFPLTDTRKYIGSEVVVFHFLDALLDDFAQIKSLGAPSLRCEVVKPLLGLWRKTN